MPQESFGSLERLLKLYLTSTLSQKHADGLELGHNALQVYNSVLLGTFQGTGDNEDGTGQRIGDKITLQRVVVKGMLELNERYSDVSCKVMVIKSAKGDVPTQSNLWQGASGNKMLDTFNTERYTIIKSKSIQLKAPNMSIQASGVQTVGSGFTQGGTEHIQSRATKIFSLSIPGKRFVRSGILQYENGSPQPKFFDHHLAFFAYSNYSTSQELEFNVARVNDAFTKLHYKDA